MHTFTAALLIALCACGGVIEPFDAADATPNETTTEETPGTIPRFCTVGHPGAPPEGDECVNGARCCDVGGASTCRFDCPAQSR